MTPDKIRELISRPGGYRLSDGVTATREGLVFNRKDADLCLPNQWALAMRVSWSDAAERLQYSDGGPWCWYWPEFDVVRNEPSCQGLLDYSPTEYLHRLSAILCDDAESFRVLHWCVYNLGGK